jgi:hypothetical protein
MFSSMKLNILNFLHNYFIMHDIKYIFSIKIIEQFRKRAKKISEGNKLSKILSKNTNFQNPKRVALRA